jgi:hypothetical protein
MVRRVILLDPVKGHHDEKPRELSTMNTILTIIPRLLQNPQVFYQSVQREEELKPKAYALFISTTLFLSIYGFVTGLSHSWLQALSSAVKMPLLFLITLAFTLPALYFFALALLGLKFSMLQALVVVLSGIGVTAFLLLGLAPVTLFFVLTSSNYPFFQLLAVVLVAISGFTGMYYLLRGFTWVERDSELTMGSVGRALLGAWIVLYGFVGAQMAWRLSPMVGDPSVPFVLFRPSRDNFFVDVTHALEQTIGVTRSGSVESEYLGRLVCGGIIGLAMLFIGISLGSRQKKSRSKIDPYPDRVEETNPSKPDVGIDTGDS